MKEYYSIPLEDAEAQVLLDITQLTDEPVKPVSFPGDIDTAIENFHFEANETFWYESNHVIGLYFSDSKFEKLPKSIGNLSYLRFFVINQCQVQYLSSAFKDLHNLELLVFYNDSEISSEIIIDFPDMFQSLKKLKTFQISGNFFVYIPPSFTDLENLEVLILEQCSFLTNHSTFKQIGEKIKNKPLDTRPNNELHQDLGKLKSIKKIFIKNVGLLEIPTSIKNLNNLKELHLSNVKIKFIKTALSNIFEIKSLESLNLNHCDLKFIPKSIGNLKNLKILNLAHNKLQDFPIEIKNCQHLENIDLTWNLFERELVHLKALYNLKQINFDEAYPEIIPKELYDRKNLNIKGM